MRQLCVLLFLGLLGSALCRVHGGLQAGGGEVVWGNSLDYGMETFGTTPVFVINEKKADPSSISASHAKHFGHGAIPTNMPASSPSSTSTSTPRYSSTSPTTITTTTTTTITSTTAPATSASTTSTSVSTTSTSTTTEQPQISAESPNTGSGGGGGHGDGDVSGSVITEVFESESALLLRPGKSLELQCNFTKEGVKWTKDGEVIEESDHIKIHKHNMTLYIERAKPEDVGSYKCETLRDLLPTPVSQTFKVVALPTVKKLPKSTTVLQGDKLSLLCEASGSPTPSVEWLKDGKPIEVQVEEERLTLSSHEDVDNASVVIKPAEYKDRGSFMCIVSNEVVKRETATYVRVKDIYAALWPFLGIVAEVVILCLIIFIYEKRRAKNELEESDTDQGPDQKNTADHNKDAVRQRK